MYIDTYLFIASAIFLLLAIGLFTYLFISKKKSKAYKQLLNQETEMFDVLTSTSTGAKIKEWVTGDPDATQLLTDVDTELLSEDSGQTVGLGWTNTLGIYEKEHGFNEFILEGRYSIEYEIKGGGMSRVFLAKSNKLGNEWIVKHIPKEFGRLVNEENVLKLLNHNSLPKIIDIFHDETGVYIVESYIEGVTLSEVIESKQNINQVMLLDWAEQIAQVLSYLHSMQPYPIFHMDMKPSNIMVTHNNRLVLIDFGISKLHGQGIGPVQAVTYKYAAPEQFGRNIPQKYHGLIEKRFGQLPEKRLDWDTGARTDIYSMGVILFELVTGEIPTVDNDELLKESVSDEMYRVIKKCLQINPDERYQNTDELLADLQKLKGSKVKMARSIIMRRVAAVTSTFAMLVSGGSFAGGYYIYGQENAALLDVEPEIVTVSLQQSSDLTVEKNMPNGNVIILENEQIRWMFSQDNIARVDGNRISGINIGETDLHGNYRNKVISLNVRVVEPMDGMVEISQRYKTGHTVSLYAGTSERERIDGVIKEAEFVSPESIDIADDGAIYIADSGILRMIYNGRVDSIYFNPSYLTANIVRCYKDDVYVLTDAWEDDDGIYYGIIKLTEDSAEGLYISDATFTAIEDFAFSNDGLLYFIERNEGMGMVFLKTLNPVNVEDITTICELPTGTSALDVGEYGTVYLANPETGVLYVYRDGVFSYFTGVENEKAFIDGTAPLFYMPQKIKYSDNMLYVWDFNVLRCIRIEDGVAGEAFTLAGSASPTFDMEFVDIQAADEITLPNSKLMDFIVISDEVLLTDPKRGVIWGVE